MSEINPIIVRDCEDTIFPDTWALDLDGETIAYVYGEDLASILAAMFNPTAETIAPLDLIILLMRTGTELARDFERLREERRHEEVRQ